MLNTKAILTIIAGVVAALLMLLYGAALYQGKALMSADLQTALIGLIVAVTGIVTVYMQARQGVISRAHSDANAQETREKVQEGIDVMHNGLAAETAAIVKEDSDKRAEDLRVALAADAARMEIAALTAKVEALIQRQAAPVAPQLVDPNGGVLKEIEGHTAETAANTAGRDEPGGAAV